ncbi:MAG TPA: hypothetical protein VF006_34220 [Longimicrobium sp.]
MMRDAPLPLSRGSLPRAGGRILSAWMMAMALAACAADEPPPIVRDDADRWIAVFAAPTDTLYLDTASIVRVREGVYRAWFRSTRNPQFVREETDCTQRRSRTISLRDTADRSAAVPSQGPWEELPPGGRGEAYLVRLCEIAPRRTR